MENDITQFVYEPTRLDNTLDIILSNEHFSVQEVTILPNLGSSDHAMVAFSAVVQCEIIASKKLCRNFDRADYDNICESLSSVNWNLMLGHANDIETALVNFSRIMNNVICSFVPLDHRKSHHSAC